MEKASALILSQVISNDGFLSSVQRGENCDEKFQALCDGIELLRSEVGNNTSIPRIAAACLFDAVWELDGYVHNLAERKSKNYSTVANYLERLRILVNETLWQGLEDSYKHDD